MSDMSKLPPERKYSKFDDKLTNENELKNCPWCGIFPNNWKIEGVTFVQCETQTCIMNERHMTLLRWNTRHNADIPERQSDDRDYKLIKAIRTMMEEYGMPEFRDNTPACDVLKLVKDAGYVRPNETWNVVRDLDGDLVRCNISDSSDIPERQGEKLNKEERIRMYKDIYSMVKYQDTFGTVKVNGEKSPVQSNVDEAIRLCKIFMNDKAEGRNRSSYVPFYLLEQILLALKPNAKDANDQLLTGGDQP